MRVDKVIFEDVVPLPVHLIFYHRLRLCCCLRIENYQEGFYETLDI